MKIKHALILLTVVSVVCDTLLLPFYPQFFAETFGQDDPRHVGMYIAACCITVMLAFPVWARVAKSVHELHLWVYTQIAAGILGIGCFFATSLPAFWVISQTMLVFKASYLLIYPFVMRLEEKDKHLGMVGLFSVLMHFGGIGGALLGGLTLQVFEPRDVYLIMAAGDALQVLVCLYLIKRHQVPAKREPGDVAPDPALPRRPRHPFGSLVYRLGLVTAVFYFSAFLIRPFFSLYWESISDLGGEILTGFVYSIPAWAALAGLWLNSRSTRATPRQRHIMSAFLLGVLGLFLQGTQQELIVLAGRCLFGWAMFQATVRLEVLLFNISTPESYATDFSKIHLFQNIGVLLSAFAGGAIVAAFGLQLPFVFACLGLLVTALLFYRLLPAEADGTGDAVAGSDLMAGRG
ncbi:MFS transporter [Exilibacterium tricleocarpae]|uniref:MFS transporter n=1 Tax=Exilibacterium tricleocarpae TaxID=2591008 RepID=A0A545U5N9_9GAMM|nr:MFS transporter [Exilibacterium tricleocarpae]TQV84723.1 MFS transporter [Exilibacterium tricleocarpae]